MKTQSNCRLYILMRNDLPSMNAGRKMAHAAHAANQFTHSHSQNLKVKQWVNDANGFGTTICLSVDVKQLQKVVAAAQKKRLPAGYVYDPEYGYVLHEEIARLIDKRTYTLDPIVKADGQWVLSREELTCGYLFVADESPDRTELVGDLPLHP